jgi:hypothetical protein
MRVISQRATWMLVSLCACGDMDRSSIDAEYRRGLSGASKPSEPATETFPEQPAAGVSGVGGLDDPAANASPDPGAACEAPNAAAGPACASDDSGGSSDSDSAPVTPGEPPRDGSAASAGAGTGSPGGGASGAGGGSSGGTPDDGSPGTPSDGSGPPDDGSGPPDDGSGPPDDGSIVVPPPEALPDLIIDGAYLAATIQQDVVDASGDLCLFNEGCVTGEGLRRVVRFGTRSANVGTADVVVGQPVAGNPLWEFDACHEHFHFEGYASYDLVDSTGAILPIGNKNGFCLQDLDVWSGSAECRRYDCNYQGISVGCADVYTPDLDCQWIDITDVAPGNYELVVRINTEGSIRELSADNNTATVSLQILPETIHIVP